MLVVVALLFCFLLCCLVLQFLKVLFVNVIFNSSKTHVYCCMSQVVIRNFHPGVLSTFLWYLVYLVVCWTVIVQARCCVHNLCLTYLRFVYKLVSEWSYHNACTDMSLVLLLLLLFTIVVCCCCCLLLLFAAVVVCCCCCLLFAAVVVCCCLLLPLLTAPALVVVACCCLLLSFLLLLLLLSFLYVVPKSNSLTQLQRLGSEGSSHPKTTDTVVSLRQGKAFSSSTRSFISGIPNLNV